MATLWTGNTQATPGSVQARAAGCTCDVYLNQSGRGLASGMKDMQGRPVFLVANSCSQHDEVNDIGAYGTNAGTTVPLPPVAQQG